MGGGGGGGVILGEVKARPKDIISFSLDYISKSTVQTSNPSSSPISLDTPARPADCVCRLSHRDLWQGFVRPHAAAQSAARVRGS